MKALLMIMTYDHGHFASFNFNYSSSTNQLVVADLKPLWARGVNYFESNAMAQWRVIEYL
jgi:hypothetical protein